MKDQWWDVVVEVTGSGGVNLTGITFSVNIGNDGSVSSTRFGAMLTGRAALSSKVIPALNAQNVANPDLSFAGQNQWGARTAVGSGSPFFDGESRRTDENVDLTYNRIDTNVGSA